MDGSGMPVRFETHGLVLTGLVAIAALVPGTACATLGEPVTSVQADGAELRGSIKEADHGSYRVHEIQLPSGTVIREYSGLDGKVFALTWSGPFMPNLRQLFGGYFDRSPAFAHRAGRSGGRSPRPCTRICRTCILARCHSERRVSWGAAMNQAGTLKPTLGRAIRHGVVLLIGLGVISCGGNNGGGYLAGSTPSMPVTGPNVASVVVDGGPDGNATNLLYTTVTVCMPGSTTACQTIDHIQVDTGSTGLRLLAPVLTLSLPVMTAANGASLLECYTFVDGYSWGPLARVDVQISGESATSVPVELIGDSRFPNVPSDCASTGAAEDTVAAFGANGILGIGFQPQDCGAACVNSTPPIALMYYSCTAASCVATNVPLTSQVPNPVTLFTTDNNGSIINLSSIPNTGASSVSGSLIFGIDTESNNALTSQTILIVDSNVNDTTYGGFTTVFNGQTLTASFIDAGSNGNYFNDGGIPLCAKPNDQFYCPASTQSYSATLQGFTGSASATVSFTVGNIDMLPASITAYAGFAGTNLIASSFDWGLPFFYGRRVVTAIQGYTTSAGMGPFVAF
jgi:hypothetical protein